MPPARGPTQAVFAFERFGAGARFEGCVGELAVYEHTLTPEELRQRFHMRGLLPDRLIAGW